jgi:hypothetical protein
LLIARWASHCELGPELERRQRFNVQTSANFVDRFAAKRFERSDYVAGLPIALGGSLSKQPLYDTLHGAWHLHRHLLVQAEAFGGIYDPHAALTNAGHDAVTVGNERARGERNALRG